MLSSSWGEDTPRSKSIPSAPDRDSSFKILSIWSKLLWTRVTRSRHWASRSSAASRAAWSRSTQISRPVVSRRAISRLCPARPRVPST